MPRAKPFRTPHIEESLCQRIEALGQHLGHSSFNRMTELLLTEMVLLAEASPDVRRVPAIILALDAARSTHRPPLNSKGVALADQAAREALGAATKAKK